MGAFDVAVFIGVDQLALIGVNDETAIVADVFAGLVFDAMVHVFFGVKEDLFAAFFVLETELIEVGGAATLGAAGQEGGASHVIGKSVGGHLLVIVDAASDDGAVGVAFEEFDDDFLPDAGDVDGAPVLAGPGLRNADPAGTVFILLAQAIPEELHFYAAVFVRIDFFAGRTYDDRGLRALHNGFGSDALRAIRHGEGDAGEMVGIGFLGAGSRTGIAVAHGRGMGNFRQKKVAIHVRARVLVQVKFVTGSEGAAVAGASNQVVQRFFFFHANFGGGVAFGFLGVNSRVIVDFVFGVATDFSDGLHIGHQGSVGSLEIIVGQSVLAGPQLLFGAPVVHNVFMQDGGAGSVVKAHLILDGTVFVDLRLVREYQLVSVLIVLKEIADAVFLHQAGDKVEGGLAILNDVFTLGVAALGAVLKIPEAVVLKNFFDDFGNRFFQEDLAVGSACEEPDPRNNFSSVVAETIVAAHASETAHKAIPMPLVIAVVLHLQGHLLANNVLEGNGVVFGKKICREMKELRHA